VGRSILPGGEIVLPELSSKSSNSKDQFALSRDQVRQALGELEVHVEYTDIYGSTLPICTRSLEFLPGDRVNKREFITLLGGAAAWPFAARAQQRARDSVAQLSPRTYRLGTLTGNVPLSANSPDGTTLLNALAQRGYTLGRNLAYDARGAGGELTKIPQLIEDFRASGVDVIMTVGYPAARHAKASGLPTVIVYGSGDPVATGW
jgi:hypothetical protein